MRDNARDIARFTREKPLTMAALVLAVIGTAGMDLVEVIPFFDAFTRTLFFLVAHESHDIVALLIGLWAAYRWRPALGYFFILLFLALHVPYVSVTWPGETGEHVRLFVTMTASFVGVRLISALRTLHEHQKNIAHILQEALLVLPEKVPGIDFAHAYESASAAARVGGDFYDIFEQPNGHIGLLIGDISGKGIGAATMTSGVKNTVRAFSGTGKPPCDVLTEANGVVASLFPRGLFVTLFFGSLDPETGELRYCSAGHPPPLVRHPSGEVSALMEHDSLLGVLPGASFHDAAVTLERGDILVMYTDGVVEAISGPSERFGTERLTDTLARTPESAGPSEVVSRIIREVRSFSLGELTDDTAILAVALDKNHPGHTA